MRKGAEIVIRVLFVCVHNSARSQMAEANYDISRNTSNSVFEYFNEKRRYDIVVKVCDQINGQRCPAFPGVKITLDWNLEDPSQFKGSEKLQLVKTRHVRDQIKKRVKNLIREYNNLEVYS